jgi:hypothetical protein
MILARLAGGSMHGGWRAPLRVTRWPPHLIGADEQSVRHCKAARLGRLKLATFAARLHFQSRYCSWASTALASVRSRVPMPSLRGP